MTIDRLGVCAVFSPVTAAAGGGTGAGGAVDDSCPRHTRAAASTMSADTIRARRNLLSRNLLSRDSRSTLGRPLADRTAERPPVVAPARAAIRRVAMVRIEPTAAPRCLLWKGIGATLAEGTPGRPSAVGAKAYVRTGRAMFLRFWSPKSTKFSLSLSRTCR